MTEKTKALDVTPFVARHIIAPPESTQTTSTASFVHYPPVDPTPEQEMRLVEESGVLEFWDRPEEDGYTEDDGDPI